MTQSPACPSPRLAPCPTHRYYYYYLFIFYVIVLIFVTIIIFSPDQKIQVTCHLRHEPRTIGPTTTIGLRPPQSGTPGRGQHLRRRARPLGDREERTGTVGAPAATPPNPGGGEERTGTVGNPAATPPNPGRGEGGTGAVGTPAAAPPKEVCREERTGTVTEATDGEGRMTLGVVPAAEGANPAASGAASTPHNARGTLQGHPNGTDAPTQPRTASGTNENVPTSATPCTLPKPPHTAVGSPGHPEGT